MRWAHRDHGGSFAVIALALVSFTWDAAPRAPRQRRGPGGMSIPSRAVLRPGDGGAPDTAPLGAAIDRGEIDPATHRGHRRQDEGNGCVNDFTRGYATLALKLCWPTA